MSTNLSSPAAVTYGDVYPEAAIVADLARRAHTAEGAVPRDDIEPTLVVAQVRSDTTLKVLDLEHYEDVPRRATGSAVLHNASDFAAYVARVATSSTTVWADEAAMRITAVINDTTAGDENLVPAGGWRDHTVVLSLQPDPEWNAWIDRSGLSNLMPPPVMAEHLENYDRNITKPRAAEMIELADTMRATKNADVVDSTDRRSGATHILFQEEVRAAGGKNGEIAIPDEFELSIAPYLGWEPVKVVARFRFRVEEERGQGSTKHRLRLGYELVRPDLVLRDAFASVRDVVQQKLGERVPLLAGAAPFSRSTSIAGR